jgi:4-amino-4-deoxychorismate lyase
MASWYRDELKVDAIAIDDRGLQYSDGLFETIAIRDGRPRLWALHSDRLQTGCRRLGIRLPAADELLHGLTSALRAAGKVEQDALLKIIVTRGQGDRGYAPPPNAGATVLFGVFERTQHAARLYQQGVAIRFCNARLASQPQTAGIKLLSCLDQVRARGEWHDPDIAEGLMLDQDGSVVSGTMSNLFIVRGSKLITPEITNCGVSGVMRRHILALAAVDDVPFEVDRILPEAVRTADEIFLCNSQFGIWPVSLCGTAPIDDWPLTRKINAMLRDSGVIEGPE